ncbi:uroporphyrinogen-III C-methyltransferase [Malaciobacter mytili]|uniref:uroporphyrinogen-III C-methyltransferase n=1 Tax=Malaciobacter mytili TaxID=603050 RepID=UPI003A85F80D
MVYLVGAGPGDIELFTLKAVKVLQEADVVLYDALVNPEFTKFCKKECVKINVGKRKGKHLKNQEEINDLLVKYAKEKNIVVRLKGGTPFVFGRGYEEVKALKKIGVTPTIISGVSSTTSVPESFMIPSIDRSFSDSYRTITGHDIQLFNEIVTNYHKRENLIIMMGAHKAKEIVNSLLKKGFPKTTPIAYLSKGTTKDQKCLIFTLEEVFKKDEDFFEELKNLTPIITFVGETIKAFEE